MHFVEYDNTFFEDLFEKIKHFYKYLTIKTLQYGIYNNLYLIGTNRLFVSKMHYK
jgi:hypothetical protein